ncbi:MAG: phage tail protein, partial [Jatrophihabitantaceae bacterium]
MPSAESLLSDDALVAQNFFLEIDGETIAYLSGVSGLDIEMDVVTAHQAGPKGQQQIIKMLGTHIKAPDLSLTRVAPVDITKDKLWIWFNKIHGGGMPVGGRAAERKNGSIVLFDSTHSEVARFNFYNAWPSKISTDALSVESNDPVKETIT